MIILSKIDLLDQSVHLATPLLIINKIYYRADVVVRPVVAIVVVH